jgi:hypothetical protein
VPVSPPSPGSVMAPRGAVIVSFALKRLKLRSDAVDPWRMTRFALPDAVTSPAMLERPSASVWVPLKW